MTIFIYSNHCVSSLNCMTNARHRSEISLFRIIEHFQRRRIFFLSLSLISFKNLRSERRKYLNYLEYVSEGKLAERMGGERNRDY